jgi:hypothetical protein
MCEPARHDHPEGHEKGWSAADFGPDDYVTPEELDAATEPVSNGDR